jgi:hypothetical protein
MTTVLLLPFLLFVQTAGATAPPQKVDIVAVTGCVTPGPNDTWMLASATDPVVEQKASTGQRPATSTPPAGATPPAGKNRYRLIGILELGVPGHKGHTVLLKGLLIPGAEKKINVTSVTMISPTCAR